MAAARHRPPARSGASRLEPAELRTGSVADIVSTAGGSEMATADGSSRRPTLSLHAGTQALLGLVALAVFGSGCSSAQRGRIFTEPPGGFIQVDDVNVGVAPVDHVFDLKDEQTATVGATLNGFYKEEVRLHEESPSLKKGQLRIVLQEDESWRVTTTSEATNAWIRIQVESSLTPDVVWQKVVDSVTGRYSSLEQLDAASGYLRSIQTVRKFRGPRGDYRIRTRFVCSISSKTPLVYKLRIESEISDTQVDWVPFGRVFKEDAALIEELQGRLGIK